jgi:hypothetical protein
MGARLTLYAVALMFLAASLVGLGALAQQAPYAAGSPSGPGLDAVVVTNDWCDYLDDGSTIPDCTATSSYYNGSPVPVDAVIDAYDPDGVHCGTFTVKTAGKWGIMHVYADDPLTEGVDEGAKGGNPISFNIKVRLTADCRPTATPTDTPTNTPTNTPTDTPTITLTPTEGPSPTPTNTPTDTPTITPTNTPQTATITPTRTNTPEGRYVYGYVRDADSDAPLKDVVVTLYRNENGSWTQLNQKTTDVNGHYAFGFSPVATLHRIVETDPSGYMSDRVTLPSGLDGTVVNANTVEFEPPGEGSVGPLLFYDRRLPTATATATPTKTATATVTPTVTQTATFTPTPLGKAFRVWLPMMLKAYLK